MRLQEPWRTLVVVLIGVYLLIATVGGLWAIGKFFVALGSDASDAHVAIRNTGFIFLAAMGAPLLIWRAMVAQGNLERSKDRDYADLFTKAVEQLGATREEIEYEGEGDQRVEKKVLKPNIEVRLGAIYALERISQDSERDHIAVMETLCAYVRENAPIKAAISPPKDVRFLEWIYDLPLPRTDVQAALTVLSRRSPIRIAYEIGSEPRLPRYQLDLRLANLQRADFHKARLQNALFDQSRLEGARFIAADLNNASFMWAQMNGVILLNTTVNDVTFWRANLLYSNFDVKSAHRSNFSCADLRGARNFNPALFDYAFGCSGTLLEVDLDKFRPAHWFKTQLSDGVEAFSAWTEWKEQVVGVA